jgi:hypothetical protein
MFNFLVGLAVGAVVTAFVPKVFEYVVYVVKAALAYIKLPKE